jgi:hypothetical protein
MCWTGTEEDLALKVAEMRKEAAEAAKMRGALLRSSTPPAFAARPARLLNLQRRPPPLAPSAPPLCNRLCPRISLLCAPFHAGHAGSFEVLREKGETEAQLWERSKKKAKGGAYGLQ